MARPIDLASHVQKLLQEKQQHTDALSRIDQTLEQIGGLLGQDGHRRRRGPGRPRTRPILTSVPAATAPTRRRKRRSFAVSGNDLILDFVRQHRNPTTREISQLWKGENRGGKVDNSLSKLVKDRKLKRTALGGGERGSRYSLA